MLIRSDGRRSVHAKPLPIKIGAKAVRHAKYVTFQTDKVAVPQELVAAILDRIRCSRL